MLPSRFDFGDSDTVPPIQKLFAMRIAVDVMGGDHGCGVVIAGVEKALEDHKNISSIFLVGHQDEIHAALPARGFRDHRGESRPRDGSRGDERGAGRRDAQEEGFLDRPRRRTRPRRQGRRAVSLGNTGGIFAAATFEVGRIEGVKRGCIATVIPRQDNEFVLLDAGANIECKPLHLAQFAVMGSVYSREVLGRKKPRVGILSVGTEDSKGNELTLEAFKLCKNWI